MSNNNLRVIMMGATGAVGTEVIKELTTFPSLDKLTLLGRRAFTEIAHSSIVQHEIDITAPDSYRGKASDHDIAICTLGVGEPSKVDKDTFLKIDKIAVLDFAKECKAAGVKHFQLLASVGIDPNSRSFYLKSKGELVEELKVLQFDRLSIFQPSMILTDKNRYGVSQGIMLAIWPFVDKAFFAGLSKYKGIKVNQLGKAIAKNTLTTKSGFEILTYNQFQNLQA